MYASNLEAQLYGAVAMMDPVLADEAIAPLRSDRNVYGVAVYGPGGRRLAGHGKFPATMVSGDPVKLIDDRVLLTLRDISIGEGASGHLYLALSTEHISSADFRAAQFPAMTTAVVLLFAILLALAHAFSVMMSEVVRMFEERRQMERTEKQRLEKLVSERTHELERGREQYRLVVEGTQAIPFSLDVEDGHFEYIGPQGPQRLGFSEELWKQIGFLDRLMPRDRNGLVRTRIDESKAGSFELETTVLTENEQRVDLRWVVSCEQSESTGRHKVLRGMMLDVTDQRRLENELAQAQKLESVGRLAAGVAHEINTPVQFVSDSVHFVREAMDDLTQIVDKYRELRTATQNPTPSGADVAAAAKAAEEAEDDADLDYILENAPVALDRARDGLGRVAAIVRSMKEFAHPDRKEMAQADLNQAIQSTLVIALERIQIRGRGRNRLRRYPARELLRGRDQPGGAEPDRQRRARDRRCGQRHQRQGQDHGGHANARRPGRDRHRRHRQGNSGRRALAHLRSVLHHQGSGQGHRPGARDRPHGRRRKTRRLAAFRNRDRARAPRSTSAFPSRAPPRRSAAA